MGAFARNTVGEMATKLAPLLCELHAHTTWSDGALSVRELADLYGRAGFDVLAVTDHSVPGALCAGTPTSPATSTRWKPRPIAPAASTT